MKFIKSALVKIITIFIAIAALAVSIVLNNKYKNDYSGTYTVSAGGMGTMTADVKKAKGGYDVKLSLKSSMQSFDDSFYVADEDMGKRLTLESCNELSVDINKDNVIVYLKKFGEYNEGKENTFLSEYSILTPATDSTKDIYIVYILRALAVLFFGMFLLEIGLSGKRYVLIVAALVMAAGGVAGIIYESRDTVTFEDKYYVSNLGEKKEENDYWTYQIYINKSGNDYYAVMKLLNIYKSSDTTDSAKFEATRDGDKLIINTDISESGKEFYNFGETFEIIRTSKKVTCYRIKNGVAEEMSVKTENKTENKGIKSVAEFVAIVYAVLFVTLFNVKKHND